MHVITLDVDDIEIGERHRALSADAVARLASSLAEMGLRQPVSIRVVDEMIVGGRMTSGVPVLVAGAHRLAAAKSLGWPRIDCVEVDDDAIKAEMWEIAENLHRLDLTKDQRDEHIRRYAELLEARRSIKSDNVADFKTVGAGRGNKGIAAEIAAETGLSQRTVRRALNPAPIAEVIPISVRSEHDVVLAQVNAILSAWNRASPEARAIAMEQMEGGPVFDNSRSARG